MFYVSRETRTSQCCCAVCTSFDCNCRVLLVNKLLHQTYRNEFILPLKQYTGVNYSRLYNSIPVWPWQQPWCQPLQIYFVTLCMFSEQYIVTSLRPYVSLLTIRSFWKWILTPCLLAVTHEKHQHHFNCMFAKYTLQALLYTFIIYYFVKENVNIVR